MSKPIPSPYLGNLLEEKVFELQGFAELLTQTGRPEQAKVLEDCAARINTVAREVRRPDPNSTQSGERNDRT
jgi:hypothetical protein